MPKRGGGGGGWEGGGGGGGGGAWTACRFKSGLVNFKKWGVGLIPLYGLCPECVASGWFNTEYLDSRCLESGDLVS